MKIIVCRCRNCGSVHISGLAWIKPNDFTGGITKKLSVRDFDWELDNRESVICEDCYNETDDWDEVVLEGLVDGNKAYVMDMNHDGRLVTIEEWAESHPYNTDEEDREEE